MPSGRVQRRDSDTRPAHDWEGELTSTPCAPSPGKTQVRVSAGRPSLGPVLLGDLHTSRPSVYLDQWVWVRLASVLEGKPRGPGDAGVLDALREAAAAGVAFPLSRTHYIETSSIKKPKQRQDLARVMASISFFRTLRGGQVLIPMPFS